jgi:hypothetical protein
MASVICQNFAQNAWRKDLCSNCFKSKDEHGLSPDVEQQPSANVKIGGKSYSGSVGTIQPSWKAGLGFGTSTKDNAGTGDSSDLRSPHLLKTAFLFPTRTENNVGGTEGKATVINFSPKKSTYSRPAAGVAAKPDSVASDSTASSRPQNSFLYSRLCSVEEPTRKLSEPSVADVIDTSDASIDADKYLPKLSMSNFQEAFDAHHAEVETRFGQPGTLQRSKPALSEKHNESSSSLNSLSASSNDQSGQKVIIHKIHKSILKPRKRIAKNKKNNVCFPEEQQKEVEVIGFGGDETYFGSDEEEQEEDPVLSDEDDEDLELLDDTATPDERHLKNVTEKNTNYNGNPSNLLYGEVPDENQVITINPVLDTSSDVSCIDLDIGKSDGAFKGEQQPKKETPKVSVKPFVQRQASWQKFDASNSALPTVNSWLYKQNLPAKSSSEAKNGQQEQAKLPRPFLHSNKVPVQHVAPLGYEKPSTISEESESDLSERHKALDDDQKVSASNSKSLKFEPRSQEEQEITRKSFDFSLPSDVNKNVSEIETKRPSQSMHNLASVNLHQPELPKISKSVEDLDLGKGLGMRDSGNSDSGGSYGLPRPSAKLWESSSDDCASHSSDVECEPKSLPFFHQKQEPRIRQVTFEQFAGTEGTNMTRPKHLHRSNSDLSSAKHVRDFNVSLKSPLDFSTRAKRPNGGSVKRQAPQPPQRNVKRLSESPPPILKHKVQGQNERRHRDKRAATLSSGTNGASVQFLLNPQVHEDDFGNCGREQSASPSPKMKKKRSRSLPRPGDLFSSSDKGPSALSSRKSGQFTPSRVETSSGDDKEGQSRGRSAKKRTKNFLMKLLKLGPSSSSPNTKSSVATRSSNKYSFENPGLTQSMKDGRRSKLQIVHPLDLRKSSLDSCSSKNAVDDIIAANDDVVDDINGNFKGVSNNNADVVVNRVLPMRNHEQELQHGGLKAGQIRDLVRKSSSF